MTAPLAYRSFGHFWCPMCFCLREFVSDDQRCFDASEAECEDCGYAFGRAYDDRTGEDRPVLSPQQVADAQQRRLEQFTASMIGSGIPRRALRHHGRRNPTDEG